MDMHSNVTFSFFVIFYFVLHSILAAKFIKNRFPPQGFRLFYSFFSIIGLGFILYLMFCTTAYVSWHNTLIVNIIGVVNMIVGLIIVNRSLSNYNIAQFLGFKPETYEALQIKGLNQFVRHPMYFGNFHLFLGFVLFWPVDKAIIFSGISIAYIFVGTFLEERKLKQDFGLAYEQYMDQKPMFLPFPNTWSFYKALF